jgi:outer membrane biosynthesis protein TonB
MSIAATANTLMKQKSNWMTPQMKAPLVVSGLFHVSIFMIGMISIPYIQPDMPMPEQSIAIEVMDIAEFSQLDKQPEVKKAPKIEKPKEVEKPVEEPPPPVPVAPKVTAKTPPKPVAPEAPELAPPAPKEKAPPPTSKPKPPEPKKEPEVKNKTEEAPKEPEEFQGLLRNLMDTQPQPITESSEKAKPGETPSLMTRFSSKMTMGEMDAVRQQLNQCWSVLAGARYAENLVVDIKLYMNPDRMVRDARIMDQTRYNHDSYFRAAADSALRAVRSPQCNPLKLPPNKYDLWKEINVRFDPNEVL